MTAAHQLRDEEIYELERDIRSCPIKWAYWKLKDPKGESMESTLVSA